MEIIRKRINSRKREEESTKDEVEIAVEEAENEEVVIEEAGRGKKETSRVEEE
jgi:hypothetical protein